MNKLIIGVIALMVLAPCALAVGENAEDCAKIGKTHVRASVTKNGDMVRSHCRKKHAKMSKSVRIGKLEALKRNHPDMAQIIDIKIREVSAE